MHLTRSRYGIAILAILLALLLRFLLSPILQDQAPLLLFIIPIMLNAWYGGLLSGLITTGFSTAIGIYFFIAPVLSVQVLELPHVVHVAIFVVAGVVISLLSDRLLQSNQRAQQTVALVREHYSLLQGVIEGSADAIFVKDQQGCYQLVNSTAAQVIGSSKELILGKTDRDFFSPAVAAALEEHDRQVMATGQSQTIEETLTDAAGLRVFLSTKDPYRDAHRQILGIIGVARDITDQKQIEASLREQANLLELAYEAIFVRDPASAITYWNRGAEELYGWSRLEALGQVSHTLLQTQFPSRDFDIETVLRQRGRWEGELTHTRQDGSQIVVESRQVLMCDALGQVKGVLEVNRDVTDRKRAEEEILRLNQNLERSLAEQQTLLDVIPVGIGIAEDAQSRQIRINPAFAEQLGIPSSANASLSAPAPERPQSFTVWQDGHELLPEEMPLQYAAMHGVEVRDLEVTVIRQDGKIVNLLEYAAPLFDEQGKPRGSVGVFLDITERKQSEAEVRQLNATLEQRVAERTRQLEEINQELEAFTYSVSHDLRAPLRTIQGFAQALLEDYEAQLDELGKRYIDSITEDALQMDQLIADLLTYSRLTRTQIELRPVDLGWAIQEALKQLKAQIQEQQAEIRITPSLPLVIAHPATLVQVLVNLISNGVKFVDARVHPVLNIYTEEELQNSQKSIRLWIEDNGIGIAPEHQERIFRVFERLHGIERYPGTGIGLAIVRKGLERMNGQSGLESHPGQGSRFWFTLPKAVLPLKQNDDSPPSGSPDR